MKEDIRNNLIGDEEYQHMVLNFLGGFPEGLHTLIWGSYQKSIRKLTTRRMSYGLIWIFSLSNLINNFGINIFEVFHEYLWLFKYTILISALLGLSTVLILMRYKSRGLTKHTIQNTWGNYVKCHNFFFGKLRLQAKLMIFFYVASFIAWFFIFSYMIHNFGLAIDLKNIIYFETPFKPHQLTILKNLFFVFLFSFTPWWLAIKEKDDRTPQGEIEAHTKFSVEYQYGLYHCIFGLFLLSLLIMLIPFRPFLNLKRLYIATGRFDIKKAEKYFGSSFSIQPFKPHVYAKLIGLPPENKFSYMGYASKNNVRSTLVISNTDTIVLYNLENEPNLLQNAIDVLNKGLEKRW